VSFTVVGHGDGHLDPGGGEPRFEEAHAMQAFGARDLDGEGKKPLVSSQWCFGDFYLHRC
jgi:hypothetical protein